MDTPLEWKDNVSHPVLEMISCSCFRSLMTCWMSQAICCRFILSVDGPPFCISCWYTSGVSVSDWFPSHRNICSVVSCSPHTMHVLLVRERSALADPYCQSTWMYVCLFVCLQLWGQISRKPKVLGGKLLWGAYSKVMRGFRMVTFPMTSRDPMTSYSWRHNFQNASSPTVLVGIRPYFNKIIYCIVRPNDPHG